MSAMHNHIQMATHGSRNFNSLQDLHFQLGQKALNICMLVIGEKEFNERHEGSLNDSAKVMIDFIKRQYP
jgi:hypothetical protein